MSVKSESLVRRMAKAAGITEQQAADALAAIREPTHLMMQIWLEPYGQLEPDSENALSQACRQSWQEAVEGELRRWLNGRRTRSLHPKRP